jgi:uncharacterized membrane protein YdbT with pleckstrin-like domain
MVVRRHSVVFFRYLIIFVIMAAIPIVGYFLLRSNNAFFLDDEQSLSYIFFWMGLTLYGLFVWLFFFAQWLDFYLDVWILTNQRIINIELKGLFSRTVAELDISQIEDVTTETKGFFATMFNMGDVYVQTAGEQPRFVFRQVPNPNEIRTKIVELRSPDRREPTPPTDQFGNNFPNIAQALKK